MERVQHLVLSLPLCEGFPSPKGAIIHSTDADLREYLQALSCSPLTAVGAAKAMGCSTSALTRLYRLYSVSGGPSVTLANRATRRKLNVRKAVTISDLHIPYQDERAVQVVLDIIRDIKPDVVILAGDIADFYALSRYNKDAKRSLMLQDELDEVAAFLARLRKIAPNAEIIYVEGNHEFRTRTFMEAEAPKLSYLKALQVEELLGVSKQNIRYIRSNARTAYYKYGDIKVGHFNRVVKNSAYTAKLLMDKYMCSLVQAHTHRLGAHYRTTPDGDTLVALETGCLCKLSAEYTEAPDWQQGLTVLSTTEDGQTFAEQVAIHDGKAIYHDALYEAA